MAGGYLHKPDGTEGVGGILRQLQAQVNALRGGAGVRSAILRAVQMIFQNEAGNTVAAWGRMPRQRSTEDGFSSDHFLGAVFVDPATDLTVFSAGSWESNGHTLVQAGSAGNRTALNAFFAYASNISLRAAERVAIEADSGIDVDTGGDLRLRELPSTSDAANVNVGSPISTISRVTSARKYKEDIADADVDPGEVLALLGRTWVDKAKIDKAEPGDVRRNVGFIAEELDALPSLRQFVVYDEDGEPDAIEYDRLTVALLAVLKWLAARVDQIEAENAELRKQVADLAARVTRLESGGK